jgi:hypothetical protein
MNSLGFRIFLLLFAGMVLVYYAGANQLVETFFAALQQQEYTVTNRDKNGKPIGYASGYQKVS